MARNYIIILSLLILTTDIDGQLYDILQGYHPPTYTPTRITDFIIHPQDLGFTGVSRDRDRTISSISQEIDANIVNMHKRLSTNDMYNVNFVTTPTPRKTTNRNSHKNTNSGSHFSSLDTNKRRAPNYATKNHFDVNNVPDTIAKTNRPNSLGTKNHFDTNGVPVDSSHNTLPKPIKLNQASIDFNEPATISTPDNVTKRHNYVGTVNNFGTNAVPYESSYYSTPMTLRPGVKPAHVDFNQPATNLKRRHDYVTDRHNYISSKKHFATYIVPTSDLNYYTSPMTIRPGVKSADVDLNQPPITNKPPSDVQNDSPVNEEMDREPDVVAGADVDEMSTQDQMRYEGMVEKMCEKYKSSTLKKVEAIPLVPSPEPVQVNVSACHPKKIPLVVGGKIASIQEFPHMALLGWNKILGGGYLWKCGGSLINERYVLTAGHCLYQDKDDTVVSGPPRIVQLGSSYMDDSHALLVGVAAAIRHPKYIKTRAYYDVALLRLVRDVVFSEVVQPACLGEPPAADEPVIATGWGKIEVAGSQSLELRSVSIPVWNMAECRQVLGTSRKLPVGPSEDSQICAGEKAGGKDTCQGDSGGPAQVQEGCTWRIVAITSLGRSCGAVNTPALYATINKAFIGAQLFGNINEFKQNRNKNVNTYRTTNNNNRENMNYSTQINGNNNRHDSNHGADSGFKRDYATNSEPVNNYNTNDGNNNNNIHDATKNENNDNSFNIKPVTSLSSNDKYHRDDSNYNNQHEASSNKKHNYDITKSDNSYNYNNYNSNVKPVSSLSNNNQRNNEQKHYNVDKNNYNNQPQDTQINTNIDRLIFSTTPKSVINNDHNLNIKSISGITNNNNLNRNKESYYNNRRDYNTEVSNDNNKGSLNIHNYNQTLNFNRDTYHISSSVNENRNNDDHNELQNRNISKYNLSTSSRTLAYNQKFTPATSNYNDRNKKDGNENNNDHNNNSFEANNNGFTVNIHNTNRNYYNEHADNTDRLNK